MRGALLLALLICTGCDSATDSGETALQVRGTWTYTSTQSSPALTIEGTVRIDQQNGADFTGSVVLSEKDVQGTIRDRTGQLSGRVVGSSTVDFDVFIDASSRRHVANVTAGDSMSGTWAQTGATPPSTNPFVARKVQ